MILKIILVAIGGIVSILLLYSLDTYQDNLELKKEIERLKNLRKDKENE